MIYSSELDRGFDIYELTPSAMLSKNEIAAAKLVTAEGVQSAEPAEFTWPAAFPWCARTSTSSCATTAWRATAPTAV
jgi:hypothetical protein